MEEIDVEMRPSTSHPHRDFLMKIFDQDLIETNVQKLSEYYLSQKSKPEIDERVFLKNGFTEDANLKLTPFARQGAANRRGQESPSPGSKVFRNFGQNQFNSGRFLTYDREHRNSQKTTLSSKLKDIKFPCSIPSCPYT